MISQLNLITLPDRTSTCTPSIQHALRNISKWPTKSRAPEEIKVLHELSLAVRCLVNRFCLIWKAAENHISNWSDAGRSECLVLNPEHLQQRPIPANPAVDKSQERLGRKETYLPAVKEFLYSSWCRNHLQCSTLPKQFKPEGLCAKLLSPAARCAACRCAAVRPTLVSFGILTS